MCLYSAVHVQGAIGREAVWQNDSKEQSLLLICSGGYKIGSGRQASSRCEPLKLLLSLILISGLVIIV